MNIGHFLWEGLTPGDLNLYFSGLFFGAVAKTIAIMEITVAFRNHIRRSENTSSSNINMENWAML